MTKNNRHNIIHPWILVAIGMVAIIVALTMIIKYQLPQTTHPVSTSNISPIATVTPDLSKPRMYEKDGISFLIPAGFQVKTVYTSILIKNGTEEIDIDSSATNDDTVDGYLYDIADRNHLIIKSKRHNLINNQDVLVAVMQTGERESIWYLFYPQKNMVINISASSPSLNPVLDQVAQSFRYTP